MISHSCVRGSPNTCLPLATIILTVVIILVAILLIVLAIGLRRRALRRQRDLEAQRGREMTAFHFNHQALREEQQRRARTRLRSFKLGIREVDGGREVRPEDFPLPPTPAPAVTIEEVLVRATEPPLPPPPVYDGKGGSPRPSGFKEHIEDVGEEFEDVCLDDGSPEPLSTSQFPKHWGRPLPKWGR